MSIRGKDAEAFIEAARRAGLPLVEQGVNVAAIEPTRGISPPVGKPLILCLPWPPSVNRYWRSVGGKVLISREGREYRKAVVRKVSQLKPLTGPLKVTLLARPPDRRRRDMDNLMKATLDSLAHANVYEDDSQIDDLRIKRGHVSPHGGEIVAVIQSVGEA